MKQTVTVTLEVPEGYELTGEYRVPYKDEYFLNMYGYACQNVSTDSPRFILRITKRIPKAGEVWGRAESNYLLVNWSAKSFFVVALDGSAALGELKETIRNSYEFIRDRV